MSLESIFSGFYAAATGRVEWSRPLDALALHLGLWAAQIVGVDKRNGGLTFSAEGGPARPEAALDYLRHYHPLNPRLGPALAAPEGRWMHCHDHFDDKFVAANAFYQEFLIPHGGRYLTSIKLIDNDDVVFMIGLMRGMGSKPLTDEDEPMLRQVHLHVSEALRNFMHVRSRLAELSIARQVLGQVPRPMLMVDEARGIVHRNDAAAQLLQEGSLLKDQGGFLVCNERAGNDMLTEALHSLRLNHRDLAGAPRRRAVRLLARDEQPVLLMLSTVSPEHSMGIFGKADRALVIVHQPSAKIAALDPFVIAECFDMTPAEARVAVQIAEGASAKQIAQRQSTSEHTVRTQIRRAMEKVGVERQVDLVRALMELPL